MQARSSAAVHIKQPKARSPEGNYTAEVLCHTTVDPPALQNQHLNTVARTRSRSLKYSAAGWGRDESKT